MKRLRAYYRNEKRAKDDQVDTDYCPSELDSSVDDVQFKETYSSASCRIDQIKNFIYGGTSSRFWMLRKHINSLPRNKLKDLPFFSWNCITLQMQHRDLDLVIRDEKMMQTLLKFLIYRLETVNGQAGSGKKLIDLLSL